MWFAHLRGSFCILIFVWKKASIITNSMYVIKEVFTKGCFFALLFLLSRLCAHLFKLECSTKPQKHCR